MEIVTIIGARPQFIKAATVSRAISINNKMEKNGLYNIHETIIHTGQHFDKDMSDIFFKELEIPNPDYNLEVGGCHHNEMTGKMLIKLGTLLEDIEPSVVLVYGDTNSTLAGALCAAKLNIPIAHIEAGLRSYNRRMPEEVNRIITDQLSTFLFCPTRTAVKNLENEGFPHTLTKETQQEIVNIGDVMFDAALFYSKKTKNRKSILDLIELLPKNYVLSTVHRAENTDSSKRLNAIMKALDSVAKIIPVVVPLHPRTRESLKRESINTKWIKFIEPVGYLDMVTLETNAAVIATDSGGVQKEAYFHGVPCVTLREETEWLELVENGWNILASPMEADIGDLILQSVSKKGKNTRPYGSGISAISIVRYLQNKLKKCNEKSL